jgi:hypothetical protein
MALTGNLVTSVSRRYDVGITSVRPYARDVICTQYAPRVHKDEQVFKVCAVLREGRGSRCWWRKRKRPGVNRGAFVVIY